MPGGTSEVSQTSLFHESREGCLKSAAEDHQARPGQNYRCVRVRFQLERVMQDTPLSSGTSYRIDERVAVLPQGHGTAPERSGETWGKLP